MVRRTLLVVVVVVAAAACGGKQKVTKTSPDVPLDKTTADKDADKDGDKDGDEGGVEGGVQGGVPDKAATPATPAGPIDIAVEAPKMTVKLVSPGKGKRTALKVTPKAGAKQQVEIVFDISEHQSAPPELGGDSDSPFPTIVLIGDSEVKAVDPAGKTNYVTTITSTDVRDGASKLKPDELEQLKGAIASVQGLTITSSVNANGTPELLKLHVDKPRPEAQKVLEQLLQMGLPTWPLLPAEPIAVGAKWQVTRAIKLLGKVDATYTTDYELSARAGTTATIKGKTTVSGSDQEIGKGAKLQKLGGSGDIEIALADGALYPKIVSHDETKFDAVVTGQDDSGQSKTATLSVNLKQATQVTPK
jgi:hypothetical protein